MHWNFDYSVGSIDFLCTIYFFFFCLVCFLLRDQPDFLLFCFVGAVAVALTPSLAIGTGWIPDLLGWYSQILTLTI